MIQALVCPMGQGLDILHIEGGRVTEKHTYAKAEVPLLREPS